MAGEEKIRQLEALFGHYDTLQHRRDDLMRKLFEVEREMTEQKARIIELGADLPPGQ